MRRVMSAYLTHYQGRIPRQSLIPLRTAKLFGLFAELAGQDQQISETSSRDGLGFDLDLWWADEEQGSFSRLTEVLSEAMDPSGDPIEIDACGEAHGDRFTLMITASEVTRIPWHYVPDLAAAQPA